MQEKRDSSPRRAPGNYKIARIIISQVAAKKQGRRLQREVLRLLVAYWRAHFQRQELPPGSLPEVCWQQGHPVWAELELALRAAASPVPARLASVPRSRYSRSAALSNSCP